jgi:LPS export ABC transporter protein LptC
MRRVCRHRFQRLHATLAASWIALPILLGLGLSGCDESPQTGLSSPDFPDQEVRSFTLTQSVEGKRQWRLTAGSAATYRDRGIIVAQNVALDFFDDDGSVYSHLVAREGEIESATNNMMARGDVVVTTTNGTRIETETLQYLNEEERIISDDRVTVTRGGDVLSGIGFESDPSLEHFEFRQQVRAKVTSPSSRSDSDGREGGP